MFARMLLALFFFGCLWLEIHSNGANQGSEKKAESGKKTTPVEMALAFETMPEPPQKAGGPKAWIAAGSDALVTKAVVWQNARRQERLQKRQATFP